MGPDVLTPGLLAEALGGGGLQDFRPRPFLPLQCQVLGHLALWSQAGELSGQARGGKLDHQPSFQGIIN